MKSHAIGHTFRGRLPSASLVVPLASHLSVVQSAVAAAKVVFAMWLLSIPTLVAPIAVGLVTFAVYNANNLTDLDEDAVNSPRCAAFVERHSRAIAGVCAIAAVLALALAWIAGGFLAVAVVLVPVVTGVLYSVPIAGRRLKDVFALNTVLVAGAWAVTVTYLPVAVVDGAVSSIHTIPVCAILFLRTVVSVEVFNVRDVAGDRASGVSTLPATLGLQATKHSLVFLDGVALAIAVGAADVLPPLVLVALFPVTLFSMVLTAVLERSRNLRLFCLAKDGEYLTLGAFALLVL